MKILLVSPFTSASGSAIRFWNLAHQFQRHGFTVIYSDRSVPGGETLYRVPGVEYRPSPAVKPFFLCMAVSTLHSIILLLRNLDCAVFYALKPAPNNCLAALLARLMGKTTILDIDDLDFAYLAPGVKRSFSKLFFRLFPRFFHVVTCHTPALEAYCRKRLGIQPSRLYYLAQGVSDEFLDVKTPGTSPAQKSIIYVATLGITSDLGELLPVLARVFKVHPEAKVTVVGEGVRRGAFEVQALRLGIADNIEFTGRIPHDDLPALMARHRIGLNHMKPSQVNDCRAVLKIREYLACGLEVVCTAGGDASLFGHHAFVENDLAALEERLVHILAEPPAINRAGRRFVEEHFRWESIVDGLLEHLGERSLIPAVVGTE